VNFFSIIQCITSVASADVIALTSEKNTLQEWAHTWQMKFNIQKCKVMRVGDSDSGLKRVSEYSMGNQKLEYCDTERDLGVIMSTDLKVESQCNEACLKANRMLGLI